jgi:hypothetical protein
MAGKNWMAGAVKPSRRGVFKAKAKRAGMSTAKFAKKERNAPGRLGKQARLAQTFSRFRNHVAGMKKAGKFKSSSY